MIGTDCTGICKSNYHTITTTAAYWNISATDKEYVPFVVITIQFFPHSWLITGVVTRVTRQVSLVEQELLTVPVHRSMHPVAQSLAFCVVICRSLFVLFFPFGHCIVCPSTYGFLLPLWYFRDVLTIVHFSMTSNLLKALNKFSSYWHRETDYSKKRHEIYRVVHLLRLANKSISLEIYL